ncbi:MAG: TOTE conflict system archaeo-eukaryotic primase domain-containing protein [Opitutaceae bacterium]
MPLSRTEELELRLKQIEAERSSLLEALKSEKNNNRFVEKRLKLDSRVYPESAHARIDLFERMFVARSDVYPGLWKNTQTGKKGYSPVHEPVWANGRRLKATEIFARYGASKFKPLDKSVLESHLRGQQVVGTYAIRRDDTCIFLAADFDGSGWQAEVAAYRDAAAQIGVSALVEISQSGNGAHAWIFFIEPVPARNARILGSLLQTTVEAHRPSASPNAFDRFFPNQDRMPQGGFGNLIALPLQKEKRSHGYTEFVDESMTPFPDQWKVLSEVPCLASDELDEIIEEAIGTIEIPSADLLELESQIIESASNSTIDFSPVTDWQIHLSEHITIKTDGLPSAFVAKLQSLARFPNPLFFEKQRQRFPTYNIPRRIFAGELHPDKLILPRGCLEDVTDLFAESGSRIEIQDRRLKPKRISIKFEGELRGAQKSAVQAMKSQDYSVLVAPPGAGKTVMGCALIGHRKIPTLVLVHRQTLAEQWHERLQQFLNIDKKDIGILQGAKKKLKGRIDIASVQTLAKRTDLKALFREYGMVIIDECHHIPAVTLESIIKECGSRYMVGLTATPKRKDGLEKLLYLQCGKICHVMPNADSNQLLKQVIVTRTDFHASDETGLPLPLHLLWNELIHSESRNKLIAADIIKSIESRASLVLSDRKEHLNLLIQAVEDSAPEGTLLIYIDGALSPKQRSQEIEQFRNAIQTKRAACLFSTASLIGEGFDLPELDTLFLTMPVSFKGRIIQYAGRLHREHAGKANVEVHDYLDAKLPLANSMYRKRSAGYREMGYDIITPSESLFAADLG